jgi:hypothetical protein
MHTVYQIKKLQPHALDKIYSSLKHHRFQVCLNGLKLIIIAGTLDWHLEGINSFYIPFHGLI